MLLATGALNDLSKEYYAACLYTAMEYIHSFGLMHRYINKYSIYITSDGLPMITDMRYAKKMDGE